MLGTLVGLPAAWIYLGPLPSGAQRVADRLVREARAAVGWDHEFGGRGASSWSPDELVVSAEPVVSEEAEPVVSEEIAASRGAPAASSAGDWVSAVRPLLAELRALGASEYDLQAWGDSGRLFRFRCAIPLGTSDRFAQEFESIAASPRSSVEQVLQEVADWHQSRTAKIAQR
jgi:hypothetical protein